MPFPNIPGSVLILISCLSSPPPPPTHPLPLPPSPFPVCFPLESFHAPELESRCEPSWTQTHTHTAAPDSLASLRLESNFIHVTVKEHTGFETGALGPVSWPDRHSRDTLLPTSPVFSQQSTCSSRQLPLPLFSEMQELPLLSQTLPPASCVTLCYLLCFPEPRLLPRLGILTSCFYPPLKFCASVC